MHPRHGHSHSLMSFSRHSLILILLVSCVLAALSTSDVLALSAVSTQPGASVSPASTLQGVRAVAAGGKHTCVLTTSGGVKCWGYNAEGQLGDGTTTSRLTPVAVVGLSTGVTAVTAGLAHTCALTTSGGVKCWGWNVYGRSTGCKRYGASETVVPLLGVEKHRSEGCWTSS